jgi:hypothetical protein
VWHIFSPPKNVYLIFVYFSILKFSLTLFLEGDNNESYEDVDEKERENDEVDDVENGHFDPIVKDGAVVFLGSGHRILQHSISHKTQRVSHLLKTIFKK